MPKFPTLGFIANWPIYQGTTMDHYAQSLIQGISAAARDNKCNLLLGCGFSVTGKSPHHQAFWPVPGQGIDFVPVGPWNTDGIIIVPDELTKNQLDYVRDIRDSGFPVISTTPEGAGPLVTADNLSGIKSAFNHLLSHNRRQIAFIAGNPGRGGDSGERLQAYYEALSEAGIHPDEALIAFGEHRREGGKVAMRQILDSGHPFNAVIASNDLSCLGAIEVLKTAGIRIPEDVAVIGFDDIFEARSISPLLTTVRHPTFSMGYQAVVTLLANIQGNLERDARVVVPTRLIIRQSCGCRVGDLEVTFSQSGKESICKEMASAVFTEARNSPLREIQHETNRFIELFLASVKLKNWKLLLDEIERLFQWTDEKAENPNIWQPASALLLQNLNRFTEFEKDFDLSCAALFLDRANQELNERIQQQSAHSMVVYKQMMSQLGQLTAEMLSAMSIDQTSEILSHHMPQVGIKNALVALYDSSNDDPTSQGTVLLSAGFEENYTGLHFNPRAFPIAEVYPTGEPLQLTILPLKLDQNQTGFVAFDAPNPELCAAIVHNLGAALRTSQLYQDAVTGRKLAEEANQLKSRFLSMVSHELRTPLSLIVGLSEMSIKGKKIEMKDVEQINASAQHLARLIGDVLDLASSEAGQLRILREPLNLYEVLQTVTSIGEEMAREKGLAWESDFPIRSPWVLGDRTRLRQITLNLISNAIKFTPYGRIRLDLSESNGFVNVSVSDTGMGISAMDQEKIFNEFFRTERIIEAGVGGMGLGLAITKQLVEVHGGKIEVQSPGKLGCGSTFIFSLPILTSSAVEPDILSLTARTGSTIMILAEEDDPADRLSKYLVEHGFSVSTCFIDQVQDWFSNVTALQPAAIVLGQSLATKHGWAIAGILKQQTISEFIPVYAYALNTETNRGELLELNFLHKPLQAEKLSGEFDQILPITSEKQTVLIVDDDPGILDMHRRMVETIGKKVITASNGRIALEKVYSEHPDLILLDLMMPEMDGFAVLDALRNSETTREIPVIILTARLLSNADIERCNRGVTGILSKGVFSADETLSHIESALSHQNTLSGPTRQLVRQAMAVIHVHYAEQISREDIANQLGISPDYLTDCFRQEFGITPITYIRRYRIKCACEYLANTDLSITQVAMNVGFSDSAHFTRTFIREMAISPKAFRAKNK